MSRTLYRVPLDFDWPIGVIWKGYKNPFIPTDCPYCDGNGYSKEANNILNEWYGNNDTPEYQPNPFNEHARYNIKAKQYNLTSDEIEYLASHDNDVKKVKEHLGHVPTKDELNKVNLSSGIFMCNTPYVLIEYYAKKEGWDILCKHCKGNGILWPSEKYENLASQWERIDPPTGEGYQMWQTTGDGKPISPVFTTPEELTDYCTEHCTLFGKTYGNKEDWENIINNKIGLYTINI